MTLVFKIVATDEWRAAEKAGVFDGAAVDRADGYIHFSTAAQAPRRRRNGSPGRDDLTLVAVDAAALGAELRLGAVARRRAVSRTSMAPLPLRAVVWSRPLPLGPDGRHVFGILRGESRPSSFEPLVKRLPPGDGASRRHPAA